MEPISAEASLILVKSSLVMGIANSLAYSLCTLYMVVWVFFDIPVIIPLIFLIVFKISLIPYLIKSIKVHPKEKIKLVDTTLGVVFKLLIILALQGMISLLYAGIPIFLASLVIACTNYKHVCSFIVLVYMLKSLFRWVFVITYMSVALQVAGVFEWAWIITFWPYWILILFLMIIGLLQIIITIFLKVWKKIPLSGPLWLFCSTCGCGLCIGMLITGISNYFTTANKFDIFVPAVSLLAYLLIYSLYTLLQLNTISY